MSEQQYGGSMSFCDYILKNQLEKIRPSNIVDLGAGGGKNARIVRQILPEVKLIAVEGFQETVNYLSELGQYDEVYCTLIQEWVFKDSNKYEMAIFGDVLEHLTPKEIHRVIKQCLQKFKYIVILCPLHDIFQEELYGNPLEVHKTYVTSNFFDRYNWIEKHIVTSHGRTKLNVCLSSKDESKSIWKRILRFGFHRIMITLQPLGLAMPFINILKRYVLK